MLSSERGYRLIGKLIQLSRKVGEVEYAKPVLVVHPNIVERLK